MPGPGQIVTCEQLLANPREDCAVRTHVECEGFTRCVKLTTPAGVVNACPTCAEARVV